MLGPPDIGETTMRSAALALLIGLCAPSSVAWAADHEVSKAVSRHIHRALPAKGIGGIAGAVRVDGQTLYFTFGLADVASKRPITLDSLFNLGSVGKVFDTALIADAVARGELGFDDPVAKYVTELQKGGDIRRITLRQLASYSSGLLLAQDHPPWPTETFTQPAFLARLNTWTSDEEHVPGKQMIYSHAGYILLHLALERRFHMPFHQLMEERVLKPLGLHSTALPVKAADMKAHPLGELPAALRRRAVQGYSEDGTPIGRPGNLQSFYHWLGSGQMYSSILDMSTFLAASLGELPDHPQLQEAIKVAQQFVLPVNEDFAQAMAWEIRNTNPVIVDKYGGLNNTSAYIGMIRDRKIGIVLLGNRGSLDIVAAARAIMLELAERKAGAAP